MLEVVTQDEQELEYAAAELLPDHEIVLEVVKQDYFWIMLVSLMDLLLVMSPAILSDPVTCMISGGLLYAAYSILTMIAALHGQAGYRACASGTSPTSGSCSCR